MGSEYRQLRTCLRDNFFARQFWVLGHELYLSAAPKVVELEQPCWGVHDLLKHRLDVTVHSFLHLGVHAEKSDDDGFIGLSHGICEAFREDGDGSIHAVGFAY